MFNEMLKKSDNNNSNPFAKYSGYMITAYKKTFLFVCIILLISTFTFPVSAENDNTIVYITDTGSKYHTSGCQYLRSSKNSITLKDAVRQEYSPCSKCNPPILNTITQEESNTISQSENDPENDNYNVTLKSTKKSSKFLEEAAFYWALAIIATLLYSGYKIFNYIKVRQKLKRTNTDSPQIKESVQIGTPDVSSPHSQEKFYKRTTVILSIAFVLFVLKYWNSQNDLVEINSKMAELTEENDKLYQLYFELLDEAEKLTEEKQHLKTLNKNLRESNTKYLSTVIWFDENVAICTPTGSKYHTFDCYHWEDAEYVYIFSIPDALSNGYTACSYCH